MQYLLLGIASLLLVLVASRAFVVANPAVLARQLRVGTGVLALGASAVLLVRGMAAYAFWLGSFGAWLLTGWSRLPWPSGSSTGASGDASHVVTDYLDVEMDHASGAVTGKVLRGAFREKDLESLRPAELAALWSECRFEDPASAQILEAYLDRMHPDGREAMGRGEGRAERPAAADRAMTREEALAVLGLDDAATEEDIRRAHRLLMLKLHPDRGGSHALAAKVNHA
jgi:hypothetical protein